METLPLIAIVQPASPPDRETFERGIEVLREMGIPFKSFVDFRESPPSHKAYIFFEILTSGKFSHLWAVRGGAGSIKLLPYLDELLKLYPISPVRFPTVVGFSDITTLFLYFWKRFRKTSVHAPMIINLPETDKSVRNILRQILLKEMREIRLVGNTLKEGQCRGLLLGGNLSTFASLCGTPYFPTEVGPLILFFEEIGERQYKLERSLLQILYSLPKNSVRGLVFGDLGEADSKKLLKALEDFLPRDAVVAYNFPFGHIPKNYPLLFGAEAELRSHGDSAEIVIRLT